MSRVKQKKTLKLPTLVYQSLTITNDVVDIPTSKDNNSVIIKVYLFAILVFIRMLSSLLL